MVISFILFLNCLFAPLQSDISVVPSNGGNIANGRFVIPEGEYIVKITKEKGAWLTVGDNTEFVIEGNIRLEGNNFRSCDIIRVTGRNVHIHGKGSITGDRKAHQGKEGEWGMGIRLHKATNVTLRGLTISNCWGDCVYVGNKSGKVTIENCHLDNGRRQGISVTDADSVIIRNCTISNVHGTNPQYAIDIEPNRNCNVNYLLIENVKAKNCEGGFRAIVPNAGVGNATIGTVEIRNCQTAAKSRYPIHLHRCAKGTVEGCVIDATNERPCINANFVEDLKISNNTLNVDKKLLASVKNKLREWVGRKNSVIRVANGSDKEVKDNKIVEK